MLEVGYWNIRGLGAPMRMMLSYSGDSIKYEDKQYNLAPGQDGGWDASEWFVNAKPSLQAKNALMNLPYVDDKATGLTITQSTAVYQYLGRKLNLMGNSEAELVRCEQTLAQAFDLRNELMKFVYPFQGVTSREQYLTAGNKHFSKSLLSHLKKFEAFLGEFEFFAGSQVTAGDFHVFEMLDQHLIMAEKDNFNFNLEDFPKLKAFYQRMRNLPQLKSYFDGPDSKLPLNNKMAWVQ
eukprot:g4739.t1